MKRGIVTVTLDLLEQILHIPEGHKIIDVRPGPCELRTFQILVDGPNLPETDAGTIAPEVKLIFSREINEDKLVPDEIIRSRFEPR